MPVIAYAVPPDDITEAELERWRAVPVAIAVDLAGGEGQIDAAIKPLRPCGQQPRLFGRAVTAACEPPDFGPVPLAIDRMVAGEVLVIAAGGHAGTAMIGEILGGHLRRRSGAGLVCDGAIRDTGMLAQWSDFPVFTRHVTPRGPSSAERGSINGPVMVGGQVVRPGDLVIGDDDGLVVLSPAAIRSRIDEAESKMRRESDWEDDLAGGRTLAQAFGFQAAVEAGAFDPDRSGRG